MQTATPSENFLNILNENVPAAVAFMRGNDGNPDITGTVKFYRTSYYGVLVEAEIYGLPDSMDTSNDKQTSNFYAFHIHEIGNCIEPFNQTGEHFNPTEQLHPFHAGDMPPLLSSFGFAWTVFYDERFTIDDIMGCSVIIHSRPDDFRSQPSGNPGDKIACGVIQSVLK